MLVNIIGLQQETRVHRDHRQVTYSLSLITFTSSIYRKETCDEVYLIQLVEFQNPLTFVFRKLGKEVGKWYQNLVNSFKSFLNFTDWRVDIHIFSYCIHIANIFFKWRFHMLKVNCLKSMNFYIMKILKHDDNLCV